MWNESFEIDKLIPTAPIHFTCLSAGDPGQIGESPQMILGELKTGTYEKDIPILDKDNRSLGYVTVGLNVQDGTGGEIMPIKSNKPV